MNSESQEIISNGVKKRKVHLKQYVWTQELIKKLLEEYELCECLYNTKHKFYTNKHARTDALSRISQSLLEMQPLLTSEEVKSKINTLRSQLSHEMQKIAESKRSGTGSDDVYEPAIWWFDYMEFLIPFMKPRKGKDSLPSSEENKQDSQMYEVSDGDGYSMSASYTQQSTPSTPTYIRQERRSAKMPKKDVELESDGSESVIDRTLETLSTINTNLKTIKNPERLERCKEKEFGDMIAKELAEIGDPLIVLDAKHAITNIVYKYKKMWLQKETVVIAFEEQ